jgi:hypothetical protein
VSCALTRVSEIEARARLAADLRTLYRRDATPQELEREWLRMRSIYEIPRDKPLELTVHTLH